MHVHACTRAVTVVVCVCVCVCVCVDGYDVCNVPAASELGASYSMFFFRSEIDIATAIAK